MLTNMTTYYTDKWAILEMLEEDGNKLYKVIGSFYGGYLDGDSWKISSGITKVTLKPKTASSNLEQAEDDAAHSLYESDEEVYIVENYSGSMYYCAKDYYGMSMYTASIVDGYLKHEDAVKYGMRVLMQEEGVALLESLLQAK